MPQKNVDHVARNEACSAAKQKATEETAQLAIASPRQKSRLGIVAPEAKPRNTKHEWRYYQCAEYTLKNWYCDGVAIRR